MRHQCSAGFTLIEIVIAIMILAMSLVTLLGLQSASIDQSLRTRNKTRAMLAARQIMSVIETEGQTIDLQQKSGTVEDILSLFLKNPPKDSKEEQELLNTESLQAFLVVEKWEIKGLPKDVVRRIRLRISWSDSPVDSIEVVYFIPTEVDTSSADT